MCPTSIRKVPDKSDDQSARYVKGKFLRVGLLGQMPALVIFPGILAPSLMTKTKSERRQVFIKFKQQDITEAVSSMDGLLSMSGRNPEMQE